jgi:predicted dehydrogenase
MPDLAWRGICTAKGVTAESTGQKNGFAFATTEVEELLNDDSTVAIFIATRHDLHAGLVTSALRAGKHVFVEKPLCISAAELQGIAETIEELGSNCPTLTVGFNRRFAPGIVRLKNFFRGIAPLTISYRFAPPYIPAEHWTQDIAVGGGRIVGEACHPIDTCVAVAGSIPVKVYAESVGQTGGLETSDDRTAITMRHANGSVSSIFYQAGGDTSFPAERIEAMGTGRSASIDGWQEGQLWSKGKCEKFSAEKDRGHRAEFAAFLEACRRGGEWPIAWDELRTVTWASLAAVESLREGVPIYSEA